MNADGTIDYVAAINALLGERAAKWSKNAGTFVDAGGSGWDYNRGNEEKYFRGSVQPLPVKPVQPLGYFQSYKAKNAGKSDVVPSAG